MGWKIIETGTTRKHGQCSLGLQNGRLILVFPRSCFGGKQKTLALGLIDTPNNRAIAIAKLNTVQLDINLGRFDFSLDSYKPQKEQKLYQEQMAILPTDSLLSLWLKYLNYKRPGLKESTIHYLETTVTNYLKKTGIESPYQALELREELLNMTTKGMVKRILTNVNAAFKWGLKHRLLEGTNPYEGMAEEFSQQYEIESIPNAFTAKEKAQILDAFENHQGLKSVSHYLNFVKFLFLTGCRPYEAVGLRWSSIDRKLENITFDGGIYQLSNGKLVRSIHSKTNKKRNFPCNSELQELLLKVSLSNPSSQDLVFLSPKGKVIRYGNFCTQIWNPIVDLIKPGTTPYCCRDTFISEQIARRVNSAIVALWVDSSTKVIERHYLDSKSMEILPQ